MCGQEITVTDEYKYLGAEASTSRGKWPVMIDKLLEAGSHFVDKLLWQGHGPSGLSLKACAMLWATTGRPKTQYACELWEVEISEVWVRRLESIQAKLGRRVLGLTGRPAASGVRMELGLPPLQLRREDLRAASCIGSA